MSAETTKAWTKANRERVREAQRRWAKAHPEKMREAQERYRKSHGYKARVFKHPLLSSEQRKKRNEWLRRTGKRKQYRQRERIKFPEKSSARNAALYAIRSGKLSRPDHCKRCGLICIPHAHHEDYSKPLDVMFVCRECHQAIHNHCTEEQVTHKSAST